MAAWIAAFGSMLFAALVLRYAPLLQKQEVATALVARLKPAITDRTQLYCVARLLTPSLIPRWGVTSILPSRSK